MVKVINGTKREFWRGETVYIGRPSKWGNPFKIGRDGSREEVIEKFRKYIADHPTLAQEAREELCGKNLVCYCAPLACHGDVLLEIANATEETTSQSHSQ